MHVTWLMSLHFKKIRAETSACDSFDLVSSRPTEYYVHLICGLCSCSALFQLVTPWLTTLVLQYFLSTLQCTLDEYKKQRLSVYLFTVSQSLAHQDHDHVRVVRHVQAQWLTTCFTFRRLTEWWSDLSNNCMTSPATGVHCSLLTRPRLPARDWQVKHIGLQSQLVTVDDAPSQNPPFIQIRFSP